MGQPRNNTKSGRSLPDFVSKPARRLSEAEIRIAKQSIGFRMRLTFSDDAWNDYLFWQSESGATLRRIDDLIKEIKRTPFTGTGKPEPLKFKLKGWWSRRISGEHRLVYRVSGSGAAQTLEIAQCSWHYDD